MKKNTLKDGLDTKKDAKRDAKSSFVVVCTQKDKNAKSKRHSMLIKVGY